MVKLFGKKKEEQDPMDLLREVLTHEDQPTPVQPTPVQTKIETANNNPQAITTEEPPLPEQTLPSEMITEEELNLIRKLLDIFRGKIEIGNRLRPLLNPENLQTTTRLTETEADFVADAHWLANQWKVFEPLRDLANEICETNISEGGKGRQEAINFVSALTEGKLLKGLTLSAEMPKKSRFGFGKKEKTETEGET